MSERIARELLHLGEQRQEPAAIMVGHVAMAGTHLLKGDFTLARTHMERLSELHDSGLDRLLVQQFGIDAPIAGCAWLPLDLFLLGFPYQAREQSAKLMLAARRRGHGPTQGWCLSAICRFFLLSGDSALMASGVDEFATLAAEHNFPVWRAQATAYRGWTNLREGNTEEGIALLKQGANEYQATGTLSWLPFLLSLLAVGYGAIGDKAAETGTLDEALAVAARTGEAWFTPELHRLKALVSKSDHTLAEREFQVARDLAKRQRSMLWQLRASTGLAGLWLDQGKRVEAHDLLAPVYSWFTEGVDTLDLKEAKALLDELRA